MHSTVRLSPFSRLHKKSGLLKHSLEDEESKNPTALDLISYFSATSKGLICHANIDKNQYPSVTSADRKLNLDQPRE